MSAYNGNGNANGKGHLPTANGGSCLLEMLPIYTTARISCEFQ